MSGHKHGGNRSREEHTHKHHAGKGLRLKIKADKTPGVVYIERSIHDEAIVISGTLNVVTEVPDLSAGIAEELEAAAREVKERDGIVGHIKAAATITTTGMVSVTDEKAMVKKTPARTMRITLAAIVFLIEPEAAEEIVRRALRGIRTRAKQTENE